MDFKQLKILSLALSLPGFIALVGYSYYYVTENNLMNPTLAIVILGLSLILYVMFFIYVVTSSKSKNE